MLEADGTWIAPGHNSVIVDKDGAWRIFYHAVDVRSPRTKPTDDINSRRVMLVGKLAWRNGWPFVNSRK